VSWREETEEETDPELLRLKASKAREEAEAKGTGASFLPLPLPRKVLFDLPRVKHFMLTSAISCAVSVSKVLRVMSRLPKQLFLCDKFILRFETAVGEEQINLQIDHFRHAGVMEND
jgi:hypothetical protein